MGIKGINVTELVDSGGSGQSRTVPSVDQTVRGFLIGLYDTNSLALFKGKNAVFILVNFIG